MHHSLFTPAALLTVRFFRLCLVLALALTAALGLPRPASADVVLYAASAAQGNGDCSDWANACSLQTALATAVAGDEVWVKAGVHKPTTNPANRDAAFVLPNGVRVYGGFSGNETSRDQRNWQAYLTILSGDIDSNDANTDSNFIAETTADIIGANSYRVVWNTNVDATAVLDGFYITAGKNIETYPGAGIYNVNASPTLANLVIIGNAAYVGGGMHNNDHSSPTLTNVTFINNTAAHSGGGLKNYWECYPTLTNVAFIGNSAGYTGGGMDNYVSGSSVTNAVFFGNSASGAAGLAAWYTTVNLQNVTFSGNVATGSPGAIYAHYSIINLQNAILWGDQASDGRETGIYVNSYGDLQGAINIGYSDVQGCGSSGAWVGGHCGSDQGGNIQADPLFRDPAGGNLRLGLTSPAIDAANNSAVPAGILADLDGQPRFVDIPTVPDSGSGAAPIVDMGAYEAHPDASAPSVVAITRLDPSPTTASSVRYLVEFSEPVYQVSAADFSLDVSGLSGAAVTGVSGGPTWYNVFVTTGSGEGELRLDIPATATITDLALNPLAGLPYTDGQVYYIDKTAPTVVSITRADPDPTNAASVNFTVTFSEVVNGLDASDFSLTTSGSVSGASVTSAGGGPSVYTVAVATGTGDGSLRLDIPATATITDRAGNLLSGLPYSGGESYTLDKTPPTVVSIVRASPNPVFEGPVEFEITFSESMNNVGTGDFSLFTTGSLSGASLIDVIGTDATYTMSVNVGTGGGTLRLDIPATAIITDMVGNPLSGLPYTGGEAFTILYRSYLPLLLNLAP